MISPTGVGGAGGGVGVGGGGVGVGGTGVGGTGVGGTGVGGTGVGGTGVGGTGVGGTGVGGTGVGGVGVGTGAGIVGNGSCTAVTLSLPMLKLTDRSAPVFGATLRRSTAGPFPDVGVISPHASFTRAVQLHAW